MYLNIVIVNIPESSLNVIRQIKNESNSSSDSQKENILFIKSSSEGLQMDFISSESHSDQEIPKYISSNKESEITEVTKKKK